MTLADKKKEENSRSRKIIKRVIDSANFCYNCNKCVNVCPLSHLDVFSPRQLINDLTFLSIEETTTKNNIWQCLTCGQCSTYCPMTQNATGVKIPELILELRKLSSQEEDQLSKINQCETHDGIFPLISGLMVENPKPPNKLGFLEGTNLKVAKSGEIAYFIGCLPIMEDIIYSFEVNYVDTAKTVISLLNEIDVKPVVLNEKCCGHDILWGRGDVDTFKKLAEYNVQLYKDAGVKTVIVSCAEGYRTWKYDYPQIIEECDFEVYYIAEYLLKHNVLESLRFPQETPTKVTYHDACRLGRMGGGIYDPPRTILKRIPGVKLIEMEHVKGDAGCCGVSAFSGCNEYTRILRKQRIEEALHTGAEYLIVPCPKCLTHFNCYLSEPNLNDKMKIKVTDLMSFLGKLLFLV